MTSRRQMLKYSLSGLLAIAPSPLLAAARSADMRRQKERGLSFVNLHTGEKVTTTFWADGSYIAEGLADVNRVLRDFRTGEVAPIDQRLLELLHALNAKLNTTEPFHVISGYRSPKTNATLAHSSSGVAKRSLHMRGMAIDIRIPGHNLKSLHQAAKGLRAGGVGYYAKSDFIHVDVGRIRYW